MSLKISQNNVVSDIFKFYTYQVVLHFNVCGKSQQFKFSLVIRKL